MPKQTRLECVHIAFDDEGVKGAHACDFEYIVDGEDRQPIGATSPRAIDPADVDGIISAENLAILKQNADLRAAKDLLSDQLNVEMTGRANDAEAHRAAIKELNGEIKALEAQIAARDSDPPPASIEERMAALEAVVARQTKGGQS